MQGMMQHVVRAVAKQGRVRATESIQLSRGILIPNRNASLPVRLLKVSARKTAIVWIPGVCGYMGIQFAKKEIEKIKQACTEWFQEHIINNVKLHTDELNQLSTMMKKNPAVVRIFTDLAVDHVEKIDSRVLHKIIDQNTEASFLLIKPVAQHITTMKPDIIMCIMENNPEAANIFISAAIERIEYIDVHILEVIFQRNPSVYSLFTQAAAHRIDRMPWRTLEWIMKRDPEAARLFTKSALRHLNKMSWSILSKMLVRHSGLVRVVRRLVW